MVKRVDYDESVCQLIAFEICSMERNPTLLRPPDNKKALHGLGRSGHQITPLPCVAFYCFDGCAVGINRFVARKFQMRWVLLYHEQLSNNLNIRICCGVFRLSHHDRSTQPTKTVEMFPLSAIGFIFT